MNKNVIHAQHRSSVWFTPAKLRALAARVLGMALITLDPCTHKSNPLGAARYFTRADNALKQHWLTVLLASGAGTPTLWMNPPFGKGITEWLARFLECVDRVPHLRALVLVPSRVGSRWYRELCDRSQCYVELDGRVRFEVLRGKRLVPAKDCARWGVTLVYFGANRARAARMLAPFGAVRMVRALEPAERALDLAQCRELAQLTVPFAEGACSWCGKLSPHHHQSCPTLEALEHREERPACAACSVLQPSALNRTPLRVIK
jgi:hypothetical protein